MSNVAPAAKPAPPPVETVRITVDGKPVDVPKTMPDWQGKPQPTTMLQACQVAGIEVPHYCYHPRLPIAGNCRMCLIEFGTPVLGPDRKPVLDPAGAPKIARSVLPYEPGTPRGAIACATPISPGMSLYPSSPATKQMREAVLESLLINHPLDCPICDQAGECKLQEYSVEHGQASSEFVEEKVHKPKQVDLGPRIMLDDERCILCSRCVRFTRDIVGDDALGFVQRGSYNTLAAYPGKPFDNNYTLNTVDLCPVGALTSKDFRFRMRVWFLKETKSLCTSCGTGCNIVVGSREEKIYRFEPRENGAVNASWMCDFGRLNYKWIGRPDRLAEVRLRGARSTWTAALREVSEGLKRSAGKLGIIASARLSTEELYLLRALAARLRAVTGVVARSGEADALLLHADRNPNSTGARLLGLDGGSAGQGLAAVVEGVGRGTLTSLLVWGEDVTQHGISAEALGGLEFLAAANILPNETTARAHVLLPGCAVVEKRGTLVSVKGRVQRFAQAVMPPGDARPDWEILTELWREVSGETGLSTPESVFQRMAVEIPAFAGVTWSALGDAGVTIPLP